jgi:hypothetical protein
MIIKMLKCSEVEISEKYYSNDKFIISRNVKLN